MRSHAYVKFTKKLHYCDTGMNKIQCRVVDQVSRKSFWLSFNKGSVLYNMVCDIRFNKEFYLHITYNHDYLNRVKKMKESDIRWFNDTHPEFII